MNILIVFLCIIFYILIGYFSWTVAYLYWDEEHEAQIAYILIWPAIWILGPPIWLLVKIISLLAPHVQRIFQIIYKKHNKFIENKKKEIEFNRSKKKIEKSDSSELVGALSYPEKTLDGALSIYRD